MKKKYIIPTMQVVAVGHQTLLADSLYGPSANSQASPTFGDDYDDE